MTVIETAKSEFAPALPPAKRSWLVGCLAVARSSRTRPTGTSSLPLTHAKGCVLQVYNGTWYSDWLGLLIRQLAQTSQWYHHITPFILFLHKLLDSQLTLLRSFSLTRTNAFPSAENFFIFFFLHANSAKPTWRIVTWLCRMTIYIFLIFHCDYS